MEKPCGTFGEDCIKIVPLKFTVQKIAEALRILKISDAIGSSLLFSSLLFSSLLFRADSC